MSSLSYPSATFAPPNSPVSASASLSLSVNKQPATTEQKRHQNSAVEQWGQQRATALMQLASVSISAAAAAAAPSLIVNQHEFRQATALVKSKQTLGADHSVRDYQECRRKVSKGKGSAAAAATASSQTVNQMESSSSMASVTSQQASAAAAMDTDETSARKINKGAVSEGEEQKFQTIRDLLIKSRAKNAVQASKSALANTALENALQKAKRESTERADFVASSKAAAAAVQAEFQEKMEGRALPLMTAGFLNYLDNCQNVAPQLPRVIKNAEITKLISRMKAEIKEYKFSRDYEEDFVPFSSSYFKSLINSFRLLKSYSNAFPEQDYPHFLNASQTSIASEYQSLVRLVLNQVAVQNINSRVAQWKKLKGENEHTPNADCLIKMLQAQADLTEWVKKPLSKALQTFGEMLNVQGIPSFHIESSALIVFKAFKQVVHQAPRFFSFEMRPNTPLYALIKQILKTPLAVPLLPIIEE